MKKFIQSIASLFIIISSFSCTNIFNNKNNIKWYYNEDYHYHFIENNGRNEIRNIEIHHFNDWIVDKIPTVETEGIKYRECSVCHYLNIEKISKISIDNVDKMIVPTNKYSFDDYDIFKDYIKNTYNKYNDNIFYIFKPNIYDKRIINPNYSIHFTEDKNNVLLDPLIKESFIIDDFYIGTLIEENGLVKKYQYSFECLFYPFKDKDINESEVFENIDIVYINPMKIQVKYKDLFIINVGLPNL